MVGIMGHAPVCKMDAIDKIFGVGHPSCGDVVDVLLPRRPELLEQSCLRLVLDTHFLCDSRVDYSVREKRVSTKNTGTSGWASRRMRKNFSPLSLMRFGIALGT